MPITINNVTINNQLSIINDAGPNPNNNNDGPAKWSGNTEADVIIDGQGYLNINANDQVPSNIHALQYYPSSDTGEIEYTNDDPNFQIETSADIPSWANVMVTRWNGEKAYAETYESTYAAEYSAQVTAFEANTNPMTEAAYTQAHNNAVNAATTAATTAKNNIIGA